MMKSPRRVRNISITGNTLLNVLWNRCETSFIWLRYWGLRECTRALHKVERERRRGKNTRAWCPAVIINPQWLTRLRTFMIHANGFATRSTRTYTHTSTLRAIHACIRRRLSARTPIRLWMRAHAYTHAYICVVCPRLWLSATQISLCVPPRLKSLDLPFSLWQEER